MEEEFNAEEIECFNRLTEIECAIRDSIPTGAHVGEVTAVLGKIIQEISLQALLRPSNKGLEPTP